MKKEKILEILDNGYKCDDLIKNFTKSELSEMYTCIFDGNLTPPRSYKKADIAYAIFQYWADDKRTKDLCKLL